jgi:hypothetical protein
MEYIHPNSEQLEILQMRHAAREGVNGNQGNCQLYFSDQAIFQNESANNCGEADRADDHRNGFSRKMDEKILLILA